MANKMIIMVIMFYCRLCETSICDNFSVRGWAIGAGWMSGRTGQTPLFIKGRMQCIQQPEQNYSRYWTCSSLAT